MKTAIPQSLNAARRSLIFVMLIFAPMMMAPKVAAAEEISFERVFVPPFPDEPFSGTIDGEPFTASQVTIVASGNTDDRSTQFEFAIPGAYFIPHTSASIQVVLSDGKKIREWEFVPEYGTGDAVVNDGSNSLTAFGFVQNGTYLRDLYEGPSGSEFANWDMLSSITASGQNDRLIQWGDSPPVNTNKGVLIFDDYTTAGVSSYYQVIVYDAALGPAIVPLPAGILLLASAVAGLGALRAPRVSVE